MLGGLLFLGTAGYMVIEGWPWRTALFMTVITISTVGYGEEYPLSMRGEAFTMVLIVLGVGAAAYTFTTFTDYIVAGELRGVLRRQRMKREISKLTDHFVICGYGRVGRQLAESLRESGYVVVVVDADPAVAAELEDAETYFIPGSATEDVNSCWRLRITRRGWPVACPRMRDNVVFVVLSARALNAQLVIIAPATRWRARPSCASPGPTRSSIQYLITGRRMAAQLVHPNVVEFLDVVMQRGELELVKIAPRGVAIISVYRPKTGLTAASSAVAMAWVTLTTAKVSPATRSAGNPWRVGRYSA
ncbi:MAG: potassium channel family protein [Caldilineaceae bacterium]